MTPASSPSSPFLVSYSAEPRKALVDLVKRAREIGLEQQVLSAVRVIDDRLHRDPLIFGEPNYHLNVFEVRVGVVSPIVVHYGVDEVKRLVLVHDIGGMPSSGL